MHPTIAVISYILIPFSLSLLLKSRPPISCQDSEFNNVDWYVIFLLPGNLTYAYFDNTTTQMIFDKYDKSTFPPLTVFRSPNPTYFWNDDLSTDTETIIPSSSNAHSKGALIMGNQTIFLSHSLPRTPRRNHSSQNIINDLPLNAGIYAQTFICMTLNSPDIIIKSLQIIKPAMQGTGSLPIPVMQQGVARSLDLNGSTFPFQSLSQDSQIFNVTSINNQTFQIFSKSRKLPDIPWDEQIPNFYKDTFFVETWTKPTLLPSNCKSTFKTINIKTLKFKKFQFTHNQDHSKWGVSQNKNICCLGDLNRVKSQSYRGGNIICFENENLANILRQSITSTDNC